MEKKFYILKTIADQVECLSTNSQRLLTNQRFSKFGSGRVREINLCSIKKVIKRAAINNKRDDWLNTARPDF